ncbi:N-acetylglucosamine-1-phosphate transferase, gamma subunit L homeolog precursor [Oopsacas minuta]|uniref:N-acetylglucosamine-1-phosphate transferase, gamma subunit L homeolog n=1 Tax=Oopsacas minuta TaxID=111878 RepID=A0AAV7JI09_9METZ|nr:N-acetylglucosamine-1-phosphate transferase, gamma subunit L homeolog precursor [Oopsacas minuta]
MKAVLQSINDDKDDIIKEKIQEGTPIRIVDISQYGIGSSSRTLKIQSLVEPLPAMGPSHLLQLRGHCFNLKSGDYNYELCPFYNISQREVTNRWNSYHGLLGVWSGWIFQNQSDYVRGMRYSFGDKCGTDYKNATVIFECSETNNSLYKVDESDKCEFNVIFLTQLVCREEWRAVYPHLEGEYKDDWLYAQLEFSLGYLTDKGVCHAKQNILKKIGWIQELNLTQLRVSEAERTNDRSLYDRHLGIHNTYDCNECQTELTALKEKLSESQTLLQLINRTFQSGVTNNKSDADIISTMSELLAHCTSDEEISTEQLDNSNKTLQDNNTLGDLTPAFNLDNSNRMEIDTIQELEYMDEELITELVEIEKSY